jgi:GDP-L-fucose synthase
MEMFKNAKILVAGGSGFIGANLILRLQALGASVRATLHKSAPILEDASIEYIQCDLTRMEDCRKAVAGMDYVFMCAANTSGAAVMRTNPLAHVTPNVVMNVQLMEAAYQAGVKRYLFISSSAAYPPSGDRPVKEDEMFEGDPPEIYYSVGWMKRYAEILCKIYAQKIQKIMPTVVVRPSNMYGPYDKYDFALSHVTGALVRRVVERQNPMDIWGTGDDVRDLIYIDDFIDGTLLAFEKAQDYLAINIAAGTGYSVKQVLNQLLEIEGYTDADVHFDPSKPSTIPIRLVDTGLAESLLGFKAKTSLREGLEKTVRWYKEHPFTVTG